MCGIVGIYNKSGNLPSDVSSDFLKKSLLKMYRRGPDDQKYILLDHHFGSGFARLAIRDLSKNGMQPMQTDCKNYTISFNGEIYNTDLLLHNLKQYNVNFKSTSDTEILLYHIKYFGFVRTIKKLDGIFAISFYNHVKTELYIARDRAGVKPLYIYNDDTNLIFSSNYNQVINNPFVSNRVVSRAGLSAFLKLGYIPSNYGLYENSFLLPQGSFVRVVKSKFDKPTLFYEYEESSSSRENKNLKDVIKKSIFSQLVSDVKVGTFLSGGIDSSLVSFFANKKKIKAFNIAFSDNKYDESKIAKQIALKNKIELDSTVFNDASSKELLLENIEAFSEPFSDFSSLPTLLLSKFAKQYVTVALSGDGGDELYYGYDRNRKYGSQAELLTSSYIYKIYKIICSKLFNTPLKLPVYEILSDPNKVIMESNFINGIKTFGKKIMPSIQEDINLNLLSNKKIRSSHDFLSLLRKNEFYYHLPRILIKVDRASMFNSLEVRVPLLSNDSINLSRFFSYDDCVNASEGKLPLRDLASKSIKSSDILDLPKRGFTMSISDIINNDTSGLIKLYIQKDIAELDIFLDISYINLLYKNHINKMNNFENTSWVLWSIFSLKSWFVNHMEN